MTTAIITEVVTAAQVSAADLSSHAETINQTLDLIVMHEDAFEESTLEPRLLIGLEIAQAQELFGMTKAEAGAIGGSMAQRALLPNPLGFSSWLGKNIPRLPRTTARKYATAFKSLGLSADHATPAAIRAKIKDIRHHCGKNNLPMPSLASLVKQAPKLPKPSILSIEAPKDSKQLRLEDAREAFHVWKETFEKLVKQGSLDDLDRKGVEGLKEFLAGARDRINARLK